MKLLTILLSIAALLACKENTSSSTTAIFANLEKDSSAILTHDTDAHSQSVHDSAIVSTSQIEDENIPREHKEQLNVRKHVERVYVAEPVKSKQESGLNQTKNVADAVMQPDASKDLSISETSVEPKLHEPLMQIKNQHKVFDDLLKAYVSPVGEVDYAGFQKDRSKLLEYLVDLSKIDIQNLSSNGALAYWINLYNAATLNLILEHYPVVSIVDIDNGKTWDVKRVKVGERILSLNQIEHEILRPQFNDARIHFAVNCAAKSCPPLANQAFTQENVNALLDLRTRNFINNKEYNAITSQAARISKIFEWYRTDFGDDLSKYLDRYAKIALDSDAKISFNEYDWRLNGM
jgi:hypothetical protein